MQLTLDPPRQLQNVQASSVLVLAPHYDDEVLGCGGLVAQLASAGADVRVLFLSDGSGGVEEVEDHEAYGERRRQEAGRATEALGLGGIEELGLPDGALDGHLDELSRGIGEALSKHRPDLLLVTSPLELTADHRAAFRALHELLIAIRPGHELEAAIEGLRIFAYEVNHPLYPDLLLDVSDQIPKIEAAMACYESQEERHGYLAARLGLLRFRSHVFPPGVEAVEAYRELSPSDFTTRGPNALVAALGGSPEVLEVRSGPKLSVVVRTRDRPELLSQALEGLGRSSYRRFEVVLVNDGGERPELPEGFPVEVVRVELDPGRGRAGAANAGVEAASGEYVAFLDDDDLVEVEHLATLAGLTGAAGVRVAYTDAAVGVYGLDEGGWSCRERRLPYSRDFDPDLLLVDNYIPFNTLLVERGLFDLAGPFDEDLPFFEDWDFLIRLARLTPFHHLARVTCEYRQFRGAGHHVLGDRPRERADFLAMKARVIEKHARYQSPEAQARIVDLLRAEAVEAAEEAEAARREARRFEELYHRANGERSSLEEHVRLLEAKLEERGAELEGLRREVRELEIGRQGSDEELRRLYARESELEDQLGATYGEIERLGGVIETMESTRAWRFHQRWQRLKGRR